MSAYIIGEVFVDSRVPGGLGDTRIRHANLEAVKEHGYTDPYRFVGRCLSEIQAKPSNERARLQWYQRKRSMDVETTYPAVVIAEDGKTCIGHRRTLEWMAGIDGRETYMVRIEQVRELPHQVTSAEGQGRITKDFEHVCGRYTMQDIREMYASGTLSLHCGTNLTTILDQCCVIAKHYFSSDDGISLAFNRSLTNWSGCDSSATLQLAVTCPSCGWQWWRRALHGTTQRCPSCRCRLDLAEALGAGSPQRHRASALNYQAPLGMARGKERR